MNEEKLRYDRPIPIRYLKQRSRWAALLFPLQMIIAILLGLLSGNLIRENLL